MQKTFLVLSSIVLCLLALPTANVSAQAAASDPNRIANLGISVWPEYDDPSVLVIYDGTFANKDGFPREVAFLVPADAQVNATAYGDNTGQYFNTDPWKTEDAGNGLTRIRFTLPQPSFHVEFYYNPLKGSPDKTMNYSYTPVNAVDQLQLEIQQPLTATNFKTDPVAATQTSRGHDFKYHIFNFTNIAAGQPIRVQVSYTKTDPSPSVESISVPSGSTGTGTAPASTPAATNSSSAFLLPAGIAAAAVALGVLGFLMWRSRREPSDNVPQRHSRKRASGTQVAAAYCHECGNTLRAQDVFCSKCGTKRK